jgi:hydroxyacylglutathione hydrolase
MTMRLAGLEFTVDHAPGHTPGSVTFRMPAGSASGSSASGTAAAGVAPSGAAGSGAAAGVTAAGAGGDGEPVFFSGDLLFAGSIGRTDLPGGDDEAMLRSLARVCLPLPDETVVLSGHGPATTIGAERSSNPFLVPLAERA